MKKDKTTSVRINTEIHELIKEKGLTIQDILDKWIEHNIEIKTDVSVKDKEDLLERF